MFQATRIFVSNLNAKMAQRFVGCFSIHGPTQIDTQNFMLELNVEPNKVRSSYMELDL